MCQSITLSFNRSYSETTICFRGLNQSSPVLLCGQALSSSWVKSLLMLGGKHLYRKDMDADSVNIESHLSAIEEEFVTSQDMSTTSNDYPDDSCITAGVESFAKLVTPLVLSVVIALSILGNLLVLGVLIRYERLRSLTNVFMTNLAVSELVFTCGLPFLVSYQLNGWSFNEFTCKTISFLFYVGYYSSGFFLILMTLHRYMAILCPLSHLVSGPSQDAWGLVFSFLAWTISLLAATPALIFTKVINDPNTSTDFQHCIVEDVSWRLWEVYQQNVLFLLTLLVFCVCYSQILFRLLRSRARVRVRLSRQSSGDRRSRKTVRLILGLVLAFFVGWAPYNVVIFLKTLLYLLKDEDIQDSRLTTCEFNENLNYSFYVTRLLAFSQCCLNPLFYVFIGVKFRNHLKRLLKSCCHNVTTVNNNNNNGSVLFRSSRLISQSSGVEFSL